ncbi:MAG: extracellular solute-binding protein [Clostridia bacterium]|nr:extracellular solute-binding protein [Clostridia bacterium]
MKKLLCLLLALLMMLPAFVSCSGGTENAKNEENAEAQTPSGEGAPAAETEEAPAENVDVNGYLKDDLPELDFGGQTVSVLFWSDVENAEFDVEEMNGEIVNDAICQRNIDVEDRLKIDYNWVGTPGNNGSKDKYVAVAQASVQAGDGAYDIYAAYSRTIGASVVNCLTRTLQDSPYIDYEKPWWPDNLLEESLIHDRLYFVSGDISTNVLHMMYCIYYNKQLLEDYNLPVPTDMVFEGTWTVDKLVEMTNDAYRDLNGNGKVDVNDGFGFTLVDFHNDAFYTGSGLRLVEKDPDEILKISEDFYSERAVDLLAKIGPWEATDTVYLQSDYETPFTEGRALFNVNRAHYASKALRDSELTYGILPVPKYDENQQNYRTVMGNPITLYAVSRDSAIPEIDQAVLECMASEAYRLTTPAIFENNMKKKYSIDDVNAQMYDIVRGTVSFELGRFFNQYLNNITDIYFAAVTSNNQTWASTSEKQRKMLNKSMSKMVEKIMQNEELGD